MVSHASGDAIPHAKVPFTAAVLIPPEDIWEPVQAIREVHDPRVRRWMPHITLLYPFVPRAALEPAAEALRPSCRSFLRFSLKLATFDCFVHGGRWATVWLRPEPCDPVERLQVQLLQCFPWCDDTARFANGFTPHLSVGRWPAAEARRAAAGLQESWQPLRWEVECVCLIERSEDGQSPFAVRHSLPLGCGSG